MSVLNVALSKRLLNDRIKLTVGSNFELEGAEEGNNNNANLIPGNLAVDYRLSPDGRYMVRVFRRRDNINIVEGVSIETGVSFIITLDYNRFRNILKGKKREQEEGSDEYVNKIAIARIMKAWAFARCAAATAT